MIGLLGVLLLGAGAVQVIRKYILRIKDPSIEHMWNELDQQTWYQELIRDEKMRIFMDTMKREGLLSDWYYVRKVIDHKGTRDGFLEFAAEHAAKIKLDHRI